MNAPFRTEPVNTFRRSKSVTSMISSSKPTPTPTPQPQPPTQQPKRTTIESNSSTYLNKALTSSQTHICQNDDEKKPKQSDAIESSSNFNKIKQPRIINVIKRVDFKEIASSLSLNAKFSNLGAENAKLSELIESEMRNRRRGNARTGNCFLQRFNENFTRKESILENNLNFYRMAIKYNKGGHLLAENCFLQANHDDECDSNSILIYFMGFYRI